MLLVVCQLSSDTIGWKSLAKKGKEYFSFFILCPELRTLTRELSPDAQAKKSQKKLRIGRESNPRHFSANPVYTQYARRYNNNIEITRDQNTFQLHFLYIYTDDIPIIKMITSLQLTFLVKLNFCFKDEDQITCNNSVVSSLCDDDRGTQQPNVSKYVRRSQINFSML